MTSIPIMPRILAGLFLAFFSASAFAEDKEITLAAGGKPAVTFRIPQEAEVTTKGDKTSIQSKSLWIYLWRVPAAKTVAEVIPQVADLIKSEFTNFVLVETKTLTVAGHEAKHLLGKGAEADDGDPGTAEVVIVTDGSNVFAACVHGEKDEAAKERPDLLKFVGTTKTP